MADEGMDTRGGGASRSKRAGRGASRNGAAAGGGPSVYPSSVQRLIDEFARLPGIGRRSAERLAFHVMKSDAPAALALSQALRDVKEQVRHCPVCYNLMDKGAATDEACPICDDARRDRSLVLVVEQPKDLIALEQTGMFKGLYHVLMGHLSPLEGIGPQDLTVAHLMERLEHPETNAGGTPIKEVVLGLNPTVEGDGTALYLAEQLKSRGVKVSRLARGLPSGGQLEYANKAVLADAVQHRQSME